MEQWQFVDGKWVTGNPPLMRAFDHATWLMGGIFDGARAFDGVTPELDLHCRRAVRSGSNVGLRSPVSAGEIEEICRDGIARFPRGRHLYIRPFMWSEDGWMAPDPASTRICISVVLTPLPEPKGASAMISKWRRPSPETAPTDAKAVCLYAQAGRASGEARAKAFDEAVMLDPLGNIAEFASSAYADPARSPTDLYDILPADHRMSYDVHALLACLLDGGKFGEFQADDAKELLCGHGTIEARTVAILANGRHVIITSADHRVLARAPIDVAGENDRVLDIVSTAQLLVAPGQQGAVSDMTLPGGTGALAISQLVKSLPGQVVVIQEMNEPIWGSGAALSVTLSAGIAERHAGESIEQTIERAGSALAEAKAARSRPVPPAPAGVAPNIIRPRRSVDVGR